MREHYREGGSKFGAFCIGASIGAVVALLFAPKSGRENRQFIADKTRQGKDYLTEKARQGSGYVADQARRLSGRAQETFEHGRQYVAQQAENIRDAAQEGKRTFEREMNRPPKAM